MPRATNTTKSREGMIDFHSHILPKTDDGSTSTEESIKMLRASAAQGVELIVATPHFYADFEKLEAFLSRREAARQRLMNAVQNEEGLPQILIGAEVHYFNGISFATGLDRLKIEGTDCVLLEMPMSSWNERMLDEVQNFRARTGIMPIMAHIERYVSACRDKKLIKRLVQMDLLIQANADFFLHPMSVRSAIKMLDAGYIDLLGSDCHNMSSRVPNLASAASVITRRLGDEALNTLYLNGMSVLNRQIQSETVTV